MAVRVEVKSKFPILELISQIFDEETRNRVGRILFEQTTQFLERGISPVKGVGKLDAYKGVAKVNSMKKKSAKAAKLLKGKSGAELTTSLHKRVFDIKTRNSAGAKKLANKVYPFTVMKKYPDKSATPPNLKLSGKLYESLSWAYISPNSMEFGILNSAPDDVKIRAQVHNDGNQTTVARPFIPDKPGQDYAVTIRREIIDLAAKRIADIISKTNTK